MSTTIEVSASRFPLFMRMMIALVFGPLLLIQLASGLSAPPSVAPWLLLVWAIPAVVVWAALRGLFSWPTRAYLDVEAGQLRTWDLLGTTYTIALQDIQGVERNRYWHGGRTMFDGLILHLSDGRHVVLSEGNLRPLAPLLAALHSLGITETKSS